MAVTAVWLCLPILLPLRGKALFARNDTMPNILLTTLCNRSCPYCFAGNEMPGPANLISRENLIYIADFLLASGQRHISLLGGEPTLHPECLDFILYLLDRGFNVTVFTNGILGQCDLDEFKRHLAGVSVERLDFVCNLNNPIQTPASAQESEKVHTFLETMGPWTTPGFNIYRLDFSLDFLFDYIGRYGMKRRLRLGIAHPVPGSRTDFIQTGEIREVVSRLYSYRRFFDRFRVSPGLDCGFPICKFSDEELGWLHRFPGNPFFGCGPAIDISPDMSVYHCFPLSKYHRKSLFEFDSMARLREHFRTIRSAIQAEISGIYDECDGCQRREDGVCSGGGLCRIVGRFVDEAPIRLAEIEDGISGYRISG